jgi:hydroxymethylbilane synthase
MRAIDDPATHACVGAERRLLEGLGGTCRSAVAALATIDGDWIRLRAEILSPDGTEIVAADERFAADDLDAARAMARDMLARASFGLRALFAG